MFKKKLKQWETHQLRFGKHYKPRGYAPEAGQLVPGDFPQGDLHDVTV